MTLPYSLTLLTRALCLAMAIGLWCPMLLPRASTAAAQNAAAPSLADVQQQLGTLIDLLCGGDLDHCEQILKPTLLSVLLSMKVDLELIIAGLCAGDAKTCKAAQGPAGPPGPPGPPGVAEITTVTSEDRRSAGTDGLTGEVQVYCPKGSRVLGGGPAKGPGARAVSGRWYAPYRLPMAVVGRCNINVSVQAAAPLPSGRLPFVPPQAIEPVSWKRCCVELFLVRHARPEVADRSVYPDDDQRPLSLHGRQEHVAMVRALAPVLEPLDHIVSSPRVRARQTADLTAATLSFAGKVEESAALGRAYAVGAVLAHLQSYGRRSRLLCVGHAPDLRQLGAVLLDGEGRSSLDFSPSAVLGLAFPGHAVPGGGTLRVFLRPETLLRLLDRPGG